MIIAYIRYYVWEISPRIKTLYYVKLIYDENPYSSGYTMNMHRKGYTIGENFTERANVSL